MSEPREHRLVAADGTSLFVRDWPRAHASAGIVLMHGIGEHCGRHAHVARFFNACGYAVRGYDWRGHGRSGGRRGDIPHGEAMLQDAKIVIDDFAAELTVAPLLLGHSMGGLFAACYATRALSPLAGLILSAPALALQLSPGQRLLLQILGAIAPGYGVPNGLNRRHLSRREEVIAAYNDDPLVHGRISARLLRAMLAAIEHAQAHASELGIRTLILLGGDDRLVDASGSVVFARKLAPGLATMRSYPGFYHEIFNEAEAGRVFDDVRAWLRQLP